MYHVLLTRVCIFWANEPGLFLFRGFCSRLPTPRPTDSVFGAHVIALYAVDLNAILRAEAWLLRGDCWMQERLSM